MVKERTKDKFWKRKKLDGLTHDQWEALCDGCGKCFLHKLQDMETGDVFYTAVACRLLDIPTCRCRDYPNRLIKAPNCLSLSRGSIAKLDWLPATCAYRLVAAGQDLPDWHYLVCNDRQAIHAAGASVCNWALSPVEIDTEDLKAYIIVPGLI